MKTSLLKYFMLATTLVASISLSAQTYNGGTWYSLYDANEYSISVYGSKTLNVFTPTLGNLTFEAKRQTAGQGNLQLIPIVNGEDQSAIFSNKLNTSYASYSLTLSNENTTQLKFYAPTGVTLKKYFKNIKLPLKKHILIADGGYGKSSESKSFENVTIGGTSNVQTVNLRSFLTNGDITITSDNSAVFRIGSANNTSGQTFAVGANACASTNGSGAAGGGNLGNINQYPINIYFCPSEAKTYNATITITDGISTAEISVSGVGVKKEQFITWSDKYFDGKLPIGKIVEDAANLTSSLPVVYTSSNDTIIKIINDGAAFQTVGEGTAIITASHAGNEEWNAVSSEKTFTVTSKKIQSITWSDNLTRLKTTDESITLGAKVQILVNAETNEKVDAPERTALLTYTSANDKVVSVSGNLLTIVGEGETTLTASIEGDEYFEATSVTVPVKVRQPSTGCEDVLLVDQSGEIEFFQMNTSEITKEAIAINTSAGVPDKLTFQHKGEYWNLVVNYYDGSIKAQQSTNGGNSWSDIAGSEVTPTVGTYNQLTVQLDRKATHIRFVRPSGGQGYHYVSGIVVTPAQYLETSIDNITEDAVVGDVITKNIVINYANVKEEVLIHKSHTNVALSVEGLGNDCGDFGSATLSVTIVPTEVGIIEDEIVVSDTISGMKVIIPVKVNVKRNNQTITWEQDLTNLYTTDVVTLTATANTDIYYTSSDSTIAYAEGNTLVINKHGQVTITAIAQQDEKYEQATATKNVTVNIVTPTITMLPTVDAITYGATFEGATLLGGEANVSGAWQWNDDLNQVLDAGMHNLKVQFVPSNTAWYSVVDTTISVTVNKAAAILATAPIAVTDLVYNATAQTLIVAGVAEGGTMQYSLDGESYTSDLPTATSAGTYTVYYKVVADANHTDVEVATLTATIAQAPLTITAEDYNILYGEAAPTYTATYIGWQGSDDAAVLAGTLAYSCDYVAGNNVGTYTITPSGVTAANYAIQFVAGTLTVNQVAAAVATAPIAITDLVYNATAQTLIVAGVAEGGTMQYSLDGESYTSNLPTATSAGTYTVYYKVVADANHTDVEVATLTATIAKASQFIEWELTNFVMEVGDTLHLTATATSGLEVTYTLDDDTYAEINGNLLIALQVGTFTVTASQDGVDGEYANYLAAESIIETITIVAKNVNTNTEMIFNESKATKIIRDGCLYIIRNNRTYNVNGQVVE